MLNIAYSPHDQLPGPDPSKVNYSPGHFYENTVKHLIKDVVRVMDNGLAIDLDKVVELESTLKHQLDEVIKDLHKNPIVVNYLDKKHKKEIKNYVLKNKAKLRDYTYYVVDFKPRDKIHRSYFMELYAASKGWSLPKEKLPTGVSVWPAKLVKKYAVNNLVIKSLLDGTIDSENQTVIDAMNKLAKDKATMYNEKYLKLINERNVPRPEFNPGSAIQKQEIFTGIGIYPDEVSKKTGNPSWDRKQIEKVHNTSTDKDVIDLTANFIDYSFAAIIKNNFIEAFYNYTVDGRLFGQYNLIGAKSARFTSSNP